jgi:hypothetical protein
LELRSLPPNCVVFVGFFRLRGGAAPGSDPALNGQNRGAPEKRVDPLLSKVGRLHHWGGRQEFLLRPTRDPRDQAIAEDLGCAESNSETRRDHWGVTAWPPP